MIPEQFIVMAVIAVLSVVQSIFGMGILIFGTPTLLLMGFEFATALGCLLPASVAISLLQVTTRGGASPSAHPYLYTLCLPAIAGGLWLTDSPVLADITRAMVGVVLLVSAMLRSLPRIQQMLRSLLLKHFAAYHIVMGLLHGLTNLGGAMLAILASGLHKEKAAIRKTVAHYYLAFGVIQLAILATVMGHQDLIIANLHQAAIAATVFLLLGNRIFVRASEHAYNWAFTAFVALYGAALLVDLQS